MYDGQQQQQQQMLLTDMAMYEHQQNVQNFGPVMGVIDNSMPDSQTGRNVILNQAESSLTNDGSSPVSMPSSMVSMSEQYSALRPPAVTRVTALYNGSDSHDIVSYLK
jgi:hypothetical protein